MKGWIKWGFCFLTAVSTREVSRQEIETAFMEFDLDDNGVVTKTEMLSSVMNDLDKDKFSEEHRKEMVRVIEEMMLNFDTNGDGLDFLEMYRASGGNLEDL